MLRTHDLMQIGEVARRSGLPLLEGPVGRAEAQGVRQGLLALADLVAGVDVEEPDRLEQLPRALAERSLDVGGRHRGVDHQRDVLLGDGVRREGGRLAQVDRVGDEQVEVDRAWPVPWPLAHPPELALDVEQRREQR